jgi:hypothetical protein
MVWIFISEVRRNNDPHCSLDSSPAGCQKSTNVPHQALLIHCSAKTFLTTQNVSSVTAVRITKYRAGWRLSGLKFFFCNLFLIILAVDITGVIIQGVFSCHILIRSSSKSVYFWSFSVMVLWRFWLLGIATSIEYFELLLLLLLLLLTRFQLVVYPLIMSVVFEAILPAGRPHFEFPVFSSHSYTMQSGALRAVS